MFKTILAATDLQKSSDGAVMSAIELCRRNYARETNVDLIVMGSHTSTSRYRWCVGSTVLEVSVRAGCPVAVVTHPRDVLRIEESQVHSSQERGIR